MLVYRHRLSTTKQTDTTAPLLHFRFFLFIYILTSVITAVAAGYIDLFNPDLWIIVISQLIKQTVGSIDSQHVFACD